MNARDLEMLDAWRHGRLSEEEFGVLQERLHADAELRAALRVLAEVEEGLSALATARANAPVPKPMPKPALVAFPLYWLPWGIAAAACVLAVASWWLPRGSVSDKTTSGNVQKATSEVTALLVDEAGTVFARPRQPGEVRFDPGAYELLSGTVHLRYVNGADLVVEGPARFEICDAFHTRIEAGRVRAIVPPTAHGFTLVTREMAYEDVGTEFGLSVDGATGASQMHVFDGQVNLRSSNARGSLLRSAFVGESVGFRDGRVEEVSDMDEGDHDRSLLVNAVRDHGVQDGRIAGARWATGRWPEKQALRFDRDSDFVEIEIPGELAELTVAVWLKVDCFEHEMSAIFNSNGEEQGRYHLQLNRLGLPRGGLLGVDRPSQRWVGQPVLAGKWVHVVSVLSLLRRSHVIYVNGLPVLESSLAGSDVLLQPGQCRLGNWLSDGNRKRAPRAFCGLVDELSIWNRELSISEVSALTKSGRPSLLWSRENPQQMDPMPKLPGTRLDKN